METEVKLPHLTAAKIVPLWVLVFFNGWFIMQTELVGARSLTPFFGNSIYVWGSVIAVFLLAMAIGYGAGGRLTRKHHSHWTPAALLVIAGGLVIGCAFYDDNLCAWIARSGMDVRWGALLASILLYGLPMVLAGTISPYSVHLATGTRTEAGSRAGTLYAVSTIGSFIGSLVTAFVLIPSLSLTGVTMGGGVLAVAAAVICAVALSASDRLAVALSLGFAVIAVAAVACSPQRIELSQQQVYNRTITGKRLSDAAPSTLDARIAQGQKEAFAELAKYGKKPGEQVLLRMETPYHRVMVTQEGPVRKLVFGEQEFRLVQSTVNLNNIKVHTSEYTGMMLAPILYKQDVKRVLIIGLGGADVARGIETCYPNVAMDVVEIDPAVIRIAQRYFFWKPSRNITAYAMDGRSFVGLQVARRAQPYDWVILDAFDDDYVPFHLTTKEFFKKTLQYAMAPDGVLAMNTHISHPLYSYQARTLRAAFPHVDAYFAHRGANVILVAQNNAKGPMTPARALAAMKEAKVPPGAAVDMRYITSCLLPRPNWVQKGDILTDTWAPVESLLKSK